jgi:hypothetical protein
MDIFCRAAEGLFEAMATNEAVMPNIRVDLRSVLSGKRCPDVNYYQKLLYGLTGFELFNGLIPVCRERGETEFWGGVEECDKHTYPSCPCGYIVFSAAINELLTTKSAIEDIKLMSDPEDDKALKKRRKLQRKADECLGEIREKYVEIQESKQSIENRLADVEKIRETLPYRKDLENAYELADRLFGYLKDDLEMRHKLGFVTLPPKDGEGLRTIRKAMLDYCRENGMTPAEFCKGFYSKALSDQSVVSGLANVVRGGFYKYEEIVGIKEAIVKEKESMKATEQYINDAGKKATMIYRELGLNMSVPEPP